MKISDEFVTSSVIDLLLSMTRRRSVSSSDIYDAADDEIDQFDKEEVSHFLKNLQTKV